VALVGGRKTGFLASAILLLPAALVGASTPSNGRAPQLGPITIMPNVFPDAYPGAADQSAKGSGSYALGTTISYSDSQAATSTFVVVQVQPKFSMTVGTFRHGDLVGHNSFHFDGSVGGRLLTGGDYRLEATPRAHGKTGRTVSATFRVLAVAG
jgi:hypothetical protein